MPHQCRQTTRVGGACFSLPCCRERQHVGGVVLPAEVAIEPSQLGVARDQNIKSPAFGNFLLQPAGEAFDASPAQTCGDATEPYATAFGRRHGAPQASGAVSVRGISTLISPFPFPLTFPFSAGGECVAGRDRDGDASSTGSIRL